MNQILALLLSSIFTIIIVNVVTPPTPPEDVIKARSTRIKNNLRQTLSSKYPYMSDEDIDKMVRKTLRIK